MALIYCSRCNNAMSDQDTFCMACGNTVNQNMPGGQPQNYAGQAPPMQVPPMQTPQMQAPQMQAPPMQAPQMQAPQMQAPQGQAPYAQFGGPTPVPPAKTGGIDAGKLNFYILIGVGVVALLALVLAIIGMSSGGGGGGSARLRDFSVENFSLESDIREYEYIEDQIYWDGDGEVTVSDKRGVYIVILKTTLTSGGNRNDRKESTRIVIVENGSGPFYTYSSGDLIDTPEPSYDFEIVAFVALNK